MALKHVLAAVGAHSGIGGHRSAAPRTLQRLAGSLDVLVEVRVLDHQVAGDDGQWELDLDLGLPGLQVDFLRLVPERGFVLQLHHGLHVPVVVVDVDRADHLRALQVGDAHGDLADGVAAQQLHDLRGRRELRVHFDGAEFDRGHWYFRVVAHQARLGLEVVALHVHELVDLRVQAGVRVVRQDLVLRPQHAQRFVHVVVNLKKRIWLLPE